MWRPLIAHAGGADETLSLLLLFAGLWTGWSGWSRLRGQGFERLPRWGGGALIGAALALVVAAAFVPQLILRSSTPAANGPRPSSPVTIQIVEPIDGEHTDADQLTVRIEVTGGTLTQATSTSIAPDTGHLHLLLDGAIVSMSGDTLQVVDIRNVADGQHAVTAEFVATDHLPFDPPVTTHVTFVKDPGATAG